MSPALAPGDWLWVERRASELPSPGQVVVVRSPEATERLLVKRCLSRGAQSFAVGSDSPWSARDSRHFGSLGAQHYAGRCLAAWSPGRGLRKL